MYQFAVAGTQTQRFALNQETLELEILLFAGQLPLVKHPPPTIKILFSLLFYLLSDLADRTGDPV
jgi:hypothetical protein